MRRVWRLLVLVLALVGVATLLAAYRLISDGVQSTGEQGPFETAVARRLRSFAIPRPVRGLENPIPVTPASTEEGLSHFADHCAGCHANDGSGHSDMGRGLYPKPPDMRRAATQELSDGELFYIIENGVKFTGMPAFGTGTPEGEAASWQLVHFIRRLPALTEDDLNRMEAMNPRSADAWRMEEAIRRFLAGEGEAPQVEPPHGSQ